MPLPDQPQRLSGQPRQAYAPVAALATPTQTRGQALRGTFGGVTQWQRDVIRMDRDGPGVLGYYLDTVSLLASLCPLAPAIQRPDGKWVRSDDPVLNVLAWGYRSPLFEQHELVASQVRAREGVGEAWVIHSEQVGWHVVTVPNVQASRSGNRDTVTWRDVFGTLRTTEAARAHKSWQPDPWEPWLPTSPVRRALPNLRRVRSAVRSQTRAADSRLVMNGMLAFDDGDGTSRPLRSDDQNPREGIDDLIADYLDLSQKAFTDDDSIAANVPFPYVGKKADYVEVGRGIDKEAMSMEDKGIEGFARDVNFPAQLLTTGPGSGNHWNEWILQEIQQKMGLAPKLAPVCADVTAIYFRPAVALVKERMPTWDVDPSRVRLEPDYTFLTTRPDKAGKAFEAYRLGMVSREECIREMGFVEVMPLPAGITEYEHWQLASGNKGAPYVAVDGANRVVADAPPPAAPAMDPMDSLDSLPVIDTSGLSIPTTGDEDRSAPEQPDPSEGAPVASAGQTEANTPGSPTDDTESLIEALASIDRRLGSELDAVGTAAVTAAVVAVAKAVIRAYPQRAPERGRLRGLPPEDVWAAADPDVRSTVDVDTVIADTINGYRQQFEARFEDAEDDIRRLHGSDIPVRSTAGAEAFAVALIHLVKGWVSTPDGFVRSDNARIRRGKALRVPTGVVVAAMTVAGGGETAADGSLLENLSGAPVNPGGGVWQGSLGTALGAASLQEIVVPAGKRLAFRWVHGYLRAPKEPFEPHLALNGKHFETLSQVPGGFHPGDHPWCTCVLLPTLVDAGVTVG